MRHCCLILLAAAAAAGEAVVTLRARSEIAAARATLGDVAEIAAAPELAARLAAIPVAELPTMTPVRITPHLVRVLAARAAGADGLRVDGEGVAVRRARAYAADDLVAAAAGILPPGATYEVVRVSGGLTVPDGDGMRLVAEALDPGAVGETAFRVRALAAAGEAARALVVLRVVHHATMLVATRAIARGEALGPDAVRSERRVVTSANRAAGGLDTAACVGRVARRDIALGEAILPDLLVHPPVVRAGAAVTAIWPGRGFAVEMTATALADARAGEVLSLRRQGDGGMLRGVAQADGTVLVQR